MNTTTNNSVAADNTDINDIYENIIIEMGLGDDSERTVIGDYLAVIDATIYIHNADDSGHLDPNPEHDEEYDSDPDTAIQEHQNHLESRHYHIKEQKLVQGLVYKMAYYMTDDDTIGQTVVAVDDVAFQIDPVTV